ncbi:unnamed protein product, partial [Urochloa humidicola]
SRALLPRPTSAPHALPLRSSQIHSAPSPLTPPASSFCLRLLFPCGAPPPPPPAANLPCARRSSPLPLRRFAAATPGWPLEQDGSPVERSMRRRSVRKRSSGMANERQSQGRRHMSSSGGGEGGERWRSVPTASPTLWSSIQELDGMKRLLKEI